MPRQTGRTEEFSVQIHRRAAVSSSRLRKIKDFQPPPTLGSATTGGEIGWQAEAYDHLELIGEVGYVHHYIASLVGACVMRPVQLIDGEWKPSEDPRVLRLMDDFCGEAGGAAELLRMGALHFETAGEFYLVGTIEVDDRGKDTGRVLWEALSVCEMVPGQTKPDPDGGAAVHVWMRDAAGATMTPQTGGTSLAATTARKEIDGRSYVSRAWRRHPKYSMQADSPMRRVLPLCREMVWLNQVVDATTKSSLPAGMILVPDELSFGSSDETLDEDPEEIEDEGDPLTKELEEHMVAPVENRASAASLAPLVMRGPAEFLKEVRVIDLSRDAAGAWARQLRDETIARLGNALDAPPEVMKGKSSLNHWTGFQVDADLANRHVLPLGRAVTSHYVSAYLRPMLEIRYKMSPVEALSFGLLFDISPITTQVDEAQAAQQMYDRYELSAERTLLAGGFNPEDKPSSKEVALHLMRDLVLKDPAAFAEAFLPTLLGQVPEDTPIDLGTVKPVDPANPGNVPALPPADSAPPALPVGGRPPTPKEMALAAKLVGMAEADVAHALTRAGSRVVTKLQNAPRPLRDRISMTAKPRLWASLTPDEQTATGLNPDALLAQAFSEFRARATTAAAEYFIEHDVDSPDLKASSVADRLTQLTNAAATVRLVMGAGPNITEDIVVQELRACAGR